MKPFCRTSIEDLGLSARTTKALQQYGVKEFDQLADMSEMQISRVPGLWRGGIQEIRALFAAFGSYPGKVDKWTG